MSGFFYNLGRQLGRRAVPAIRKSKLIYDSVAGTEEEALRAELALGRDMAAELRRSMAMSSDPARVALVSDLCQRLSLGLRDKRRPLQCEVLQDPLPMAMALPGGFLFISDSLIEWCERSQDELAFAIGHEIGHVIRGHAWDRMVNETALNAISALTARASGALGSWFRQQGTALLRSAYEQENEFEADEFGFRLALAARFGPTGATGLLRRLQTSTSTPGTMGSYFGSHPSASERLARIARLSRQLVGQ